MTKEEHISSEEVQKRMQMVKENCVFCKMASKEMDSKMVFEDDVCFAILDINPATNGHLLLIPKEHYMMLPMVPDEILGHLSVISKYLTDLLKESMQCKNTTVFMANGKAAGQQSSHFMIHLIPRYEHDGLNFDLKGEKLSEDELNDLASKFKSRLLKESK